ncbi:hypothetical protein ACFLZ3_02945 [Candidatus Omnitrophota bacterium]
MILHIDMDAFFASIEQAVNPRLRGKPLIVGSRGARMHTVVCAASYEAKALGIDSGMPSKEAFRLCPNLEFVPSSQGKYIWTSERIFSLLESYGFTAHYASIDEFQMDIRGEEPCYLARCIQEEIYQAFNITASIGVAKNCLLAKLASKLNKPNGIAILEPANLTRVLAVTPVEKLCGIGPKTAIVFWSLGVKTCLDLYQKSPHFLQRSLGQYGLNLYASLHSSDRLAAEPTDQKPKSVGHSYTLPMASQNQGFIHGWIRLLSEMVARRLRQNHLCARTVHLWLNGPEIGNFGSQKAYKEPTDDGLEIHRRTLKIMAKKGLQRPKVRALGVSCSSLFEAQKQALLREDKKRGELLEAVDRINSRSGEWTIYPASVTFARVTLPH